jgi:hypothetical protein
MPNSISTEFVASWDFLIDIFWAAIDHAPVRWELLEYWEQPDDADIEMVWNEDYENPCLEPSGAAVTPDLETDISRHGRPSSPASGAAHRERVLARLNKRYQPILDERLRPALHPRQWNDEDNAPRVIGRYLTAVLEY